MSKNSLFSPFCHPRTLPPGAAAPLLLPSYDTCHPRFDLDVTYDPNNLTTTTGMATFIENTLMHCTVAAEVYN